MIYLDNKTPHYRIEVSSLVFRPITAVREGLLAPVMLTHVRPLARVGPQVDLEVLQTREGFRAALKLQTGQNSCLSMIASMI